MRQVKTKYKNRGIEIAKTLWPELALEPEGSFWDKYGIDGYLSGNQMQIKFDRRITLSGNIYHEIYEKSANRPEQPWRKSPGIATHYIFTTETSTYIMGILIPTNSLAEAETSKPLIAINPNDGDCTSLGFIIPYPDISEDAEFRKQSKKPQF